jgi:DNA-binding LacI/PurR family transcriptional regulator
VFDLCSRTGRPVALLDETGSFTLPRPAGPHHQMFTAACSPHAGRRVARHLLGLGHRRIAFISPVHGMEWSQTRLTGLREVFAEAGLPDAVRAFVTEGGFYPRRTGLEQQIERLMGMFPQPMSEEDQLLARAVRSSGDSIDMAMRTEIVHGRLVPILEQALKDRSITAWVAVSDGFALDCLDFLRDRGVGVPGDLSVIGFDDSHEAFRHGLTSYNFNGPALMHAMVAHVLSRRLPGHTTGSREPIEIDGFISARRTVGRPS